MARRAERSRSRSRSASRKRGSSRGRRSGRRKERSSKKARAESPERSSKWKGRESRRGSGTKKALEELRFLEINDESHVYSTCDLLLLVGKYLLQLGNEAQLPVDVYELRRGLGAHFAGPHRLRFNTVCSIRALSAVLKHLYHGGKLKEEHSDAEEPDDSRRSRKNGRRRDRKGGVDEADDRDARDGGDDKDGGDDRTESDTAERSPEDPEDNPGDVEVDINEDDADDDAAPASDLEGAHQAEGHPEGGHDAGRASLHEFLEALQEPPDQSFREVELRRALVFLGVRNDVLCVTDVKIPQLKRLLLRNRKKQRQVDLGDELQFGGETSLYGSSDAPLDSAASDSVKRSSGDLPYVDAEGPEAALDDLYRALYQNTAREMARVAHFQQGDKSGFREVCAHGTRADCRMRNPMAFVCNKVHFKRIILPNTLVQLGDCSYLDTCRHIETCRFVHYQVESDLPPRAPIDEVSQGQWICCDVRKLDFSIFNPHVAVVMADPPWDIHMDLPYGTMKDSEMRNLKVQHIQSEGLLFLWVTGRTLEVGRECMEIWGYRQVDEIVWVKTNQLQRIIRTGRTGHWINHSKEHCLIGVKGNPVINRFLDCDVVVSEVRETSRKPDEIYRLIERMVPGALKLEIFGRSHNVRNNWITLGNQLDGYKLTHPEIKARYEHMLASAEAAAAAAAAAATASPKA